MTMTREKTNVFFSNASHFKIVEIKEINILYT